MTGGESREARATSDPTASEKRAMTVAEDIFANLPDVNIFGPLVKAARAGDLVGWNAALDAALVETRKGIDADLGVDAGNALTLLCRSIEALRRPQDG